MFYQKMQAEQQKLQSQINQIQEQLSEFPDGNLLCAKNGSYTKWYHSCNHQITYLPRKNRSLAELLAQKKYLSYFLQDLLQRKAAVDAYLSNHPGHTMKSDTLLSETSGYRELLLPHFSHSSEKAILWQNTPFEKIQSIQNI